MTLKTSGLTLIAVVLSAATAWAYAPVFAELAHRWSVDPQYSHGYLVPLFAAMILVLRREKVAAIQIGVYWLGLPLIATGSAMYVVGGLLANDAITATAILPTVAGLVALFTGLPGLRWSWPAILYLGFMIPLPYALETALSMPLRSLATSGSTWLLQTIGLPAVAEGNIISLENGRVEVAEACSGLSMFLTFFALAVLVLLVVRPPLPDAGAVILTVPVIAVLVNILRITANGVAVDAYGVETAYAWFHDQAGWIMMPLAIGLLFLELWVLRRTFPMNASVPKSI